MGIEGSNPSLSAIFILNDKNHDVKQRANYQARLVICSFFFMPSALIAEKSARARDFLAGLPCVTRPLRGCVTQAHGGLTPARVESLALRHFFLQKMANEAARLLFTVRSTTSHLHAAPAALHLKPKVFFTSSQNSRSLACEDAPFHL